MTVGHIVRGRNTDAAVLAPLTEPAEIAKPLSWSR